MSWSKIKNIMIGILVLINLFLLADIALTKFMSTALPKGTSEHFESVLGKSGIQIDEAVVPKYYETRKELSARFYTIDELTQIFIGEKVQYVSDGQTVIASLDDKRIEFSGNYFKYSTLKSAVEKNGEDILKALEKRGISSDGAVYDAEDGRVKIFCDGIEIEGIYLDIELSADGEICSAEGIWPVIKETGTNDKISIISATDAICHALTEGSCITDIEKIYILEVVNHEPQIGIAWKILADGKSFIIQ